MSSKLAAQLPFVIDQRTTVGTEPSPAVPPVIVVVGDVALVIVPGPDWIVQSPVPTTGVLAAMKNVDVAHWSISTPASASVGEALLVSTTSSLLAVHTPLLIVQRSVTLLPAVSPVTVLASSVSSVITAPLAAPTIVHNPLPDTAALPDRVKLPSLHCSWSGPASAVVGS